MNDGELKMKNEHKNVLKEKSFTFRINIVELNKKLVNNKFVMSKQLLRIGMAVEAMIREAEFAQSRRDFISKLYIALKECNESYYWLELLHRTGYTDAASFKTHSDQSNDLISMLVNSIKTSKKTKQTWIMTN
ncbi:four helix bundle protein [Chryseobacterium taeanense]|uniref:Four helix bundle protein n=1 Tax=Chryseobacterium taeanense TaxID=311334 RepID=A0A1G8FS10_9FLAO|nr:four helix bundle protein [Chryseobacterium taeanense]SDH84900.1 four helix bundle protein [Chryseobacterium taeanense]